MIYDFALEPELVATWHDKRVAYPVLCQMGFGLRRVACVFPSAAWKGLVMSALQSGIPQAEGARWQTARKNIDILVRHLLETATRRNGRLGPGETWQEAAVREHSEFPFGGILVQNATARHPHVVVASRLGEEEFPAWAPPAAPVGRNSAELARALAPLLRCANQLRFVDQYFDADVDSFFEPMRAYLWEAQRRRNIGDLRIQIHFAVRPEQVQQASRLRGRPVTESEVAADRLSACERRLGPLLQSGVTASAIAWGQPANGIRMHNRYVLTEIGGVALGTGLDQNPHGGRQTDDLTVLSKEQCQARWEEFSENGSVHRLIERRQVSRAPSADRR